MIRIPALVTMSLAFCLGICAAGPPLAVCDILKDSPRYSDQRFEIRGVLGEEFGQLVLTSAACFKSFGRSTTALPVLGPGAESLTAHSPPGLRAFWQERSRWDKSGRKGELVVTLSGRLQPAAAKLYHDYTSESGTLRVLMLYFHFTDARDIRIEKRRLLK